jgi:hypothetical protein
MAVYEPPFNTSTETTCGESSFRRKIQDMKKLTILSLTFPALVVMFLTSCASERPAAVTSTTTTHEETVQPSAATTTTHQTTTGRY